RQKLQRAWKGGVVIRMFLFFSSRRRHTRFSRDWSSDVCSSDLGRVAGLGGHEALARVSLAHAQELLQRPADAPAHGLPEVFQELDRKSTRLNSSHVKISYAVFCLKKKNLKDEFQ